MILGVKKERDESSQEGKSEGEIGTEQDRLLSLPSSVTSVGQPACAQDRAGMGCQWEQKIHGLGPWGLSLGGCCLHAA